jgi:hypothetical protein
VKATSSPPVSNVASPTASIGTCKEAYESSGNSKCVLLAMALGLHDISIDTNQEPSSRSRRSFVPGANELNN